MNIEKIIKKLPTGFVDDVAGYSPAQLKEVVIQSETNIRETENTRDNDEKLQGAKELVKDFSGPYKEAIAAQRAKIKYVLHLLDEKGALPGAEE